MLCRSSGERPAVLAITASRTLSGSGASGWSRIWLTKNGLPAVRRWTSAGSSWWPVEQLGDGGPAQRRELHAAHTGCGHEIAHHRAERGIGADRVAARHDHQQRQRVDAAGEEAHEVGGRLVGPVQVLHDEHAGRFAQGVQHRGEDLVLGRRVAQAGGDGGPEPARDVAERAERARGAQRVAHAPQHRHRHPLGERAQEGRLADARLTDEQHQAATTRRRPIGPGLQHVDRVFALQKPHDEV